MDFKPVCTHARQAASFTDRHALHINMNIIYNASTQSPQDVQSDLEAWANQKGYEYEYQVQESARPKQPQTDIKIPYDPMNQHGLAQSRQFPLAGASSQMPFRPMPDEGRVHDGSLASISTARPPNESDQVEATSDSSIVNDRSIGQREEEEEEEGGKNSLFSLAFSTAARSATSISFENDRARNRAWRILFSRWGGMPQAPCGQVLSSLLDALQFDEPRKFTSKEGDVPVPSWWPANIKWQSPSRLDVTGKKACIAYIALLPLYNPNVVDAKVRETGFHNYRDLLKWHLNDDLDLRTKYNRTTGDGRESIVVDAPAEIADEKAAKGDNTTSTELRDRRTMIEELLKVAERVDATRKGEIDDYAPLPLKAVPQSCTRAMYGSGKGKDSKMRDQWGRGPSEWKCGTSTPFDLPVSRKRSRDESSPTPDTAKKSSAPAVSESSTHISSSMQPHAFAIRTDFNAGGNVSASSFSSDGSALKCEEESPTEPDLDNYQSTFGTGFTGNADMGSGFPASSTAASFDHPQSMPDIGPFAGDSTISTDQYITLRTPGHFPSTANEFFTYPNQHGERWGGRQPPETPAGADMGLIPSTMFQVPQPGLNMTGMASAHAPMAHDMSYPAGTPDYQNYYLQEDPTPQHLQNDRQYVPRGRWLQSPEEVRMFSPSCHCPQCLMGRPH